MNQRVDPFASLADNPIFTPKPRAEKPAASQETVEQIAEQNNFPSRQAPKVAREKIKKRRIYRTGRDQQFNLKTSAQTKERFYRIADEKNASLAELLEQALDALERAGGSN